MSKDETFVDTAGAAWIAGRPFNDLQTLPPKVEVETKPVLKRCIAARAALAELKQAAELIPNQAVLISTLPLLEAGASSEIENIVTSADQLFQHANDEARADPATREALRYSRALLDGYRALATQPLTTRTAEIICSRIKGVEMTVRRLPGTALRNTVTNEVVYTPPEGETLLRDRLANWERFMHEATDLDPLIRLAIGHYQFEAIHPFTDGNGRTGRVLNSLFLVEQGLLTLPILYLSRYINRNRVEYYRLLLRVTSDADWEAWTLYMLRGIEETARWTTQRIATIRALQAHTIDYLRQQRPGVYSHDLVSLIFERPYCRIADVTERGIAKRQTASVYLKKLVAIGVLAEVPTSKEKLFVHPKLMRLLAEDAADFERYPGPETQ